MGDANKLCGDQIRSQEAQDAARAKKQKTTNNQPLLAQMYSYFIFYERQYCVSFKFEV